MSWENKPFARRVLLVTSDTRYRDDTVKLLGEQGYEVRSAKDGFEALVVLRGATPDLLICELNLPRMSGFELLSVVRTRFPQIAVIAISDEYSSLTPSSEAIADTFLDKRPRGRSELLMAARDLIAESPLRAPKPKADLAPVWIPRSSTGYIIITCPECLRSFSVAQPAAIAAGPQIESCLACGAKIRYQVDSAILADLGKRLPTTRAQDMLDRTTAAYSHAMKTVSNTKAVLNRHKPKP